MTAYFQRDTFLVPTTISICLSMFGCFIIMLSYFLFPDLRTTPRKIVVYISIGDFFTVLPYLISLWNYPESVDNKNYCKTQSFITSTAVMCSFMWTSSLAIYLYVLLVKKDQNMADKLMTPFHIINWTLPLVVNAIALGLDALGSARGSGTEHTKNTGGWCWIKESTNTTENDNTSTVIWMLACGKLCEIISYFVNGIFYVLVILKIKQELHASRHQLSGESIQSALQGQRKFALAPFLFVLLRIWGTIRFILDCFKVKLQYNHTRVYQFLLFSHMIGDTSQAFVNFLLFCVFTKKFRANVKAMFRKVSRHHSEDNSLVTRSQESTQEHQYLIKNPGQITFYT